MMKSYKPLMIGTSACPKNPAARGFDPTSVAGLCHSTSFMEGLSGSAARGARSRIRGVVEKVGSDVNT